MHELSIARGLIEVACEAMGQNEPSTAGPVLSLLVRVGALAGVVPEALEFCYSVSVKGTPLEGSRLVIQDQPVVVFCPRCLENKTIQDMGRFRCPACNTPTPELVHGRELELISMELADGDEPITEPPSPDPGSPPGAAEGQ